MDAVDGDKKAEKIAAHAGKELTNLVEIGPRFVLTPIRLFSGSFGGPTLYANPKCVGVEREGGGGLTFFLCLSPPTPRPPPVRYVSPNAQRQAAKSQYGDKYAKRRQATDFRKEKEEVNVLPVPDLHDTFR